MWFLFRVVNLIYLLVSGYVWFSFVLPSHIIPILVSLFMVICYAFGHLDIRITPRAMGLFLVLILYSMWNFIILGPQYTTLILMSYLPAILIFMLDVPHQQDLLDFVTKWMCYILGASLSLYLLSFVVPMPHFTFMPSGMDDIYSPFENYIIFLKRTAYSGQAIEVIRFCGPFIEPGHLSMVCCLLLFANKYQLKQKPLMWILVVCVLISLSLAGYIVLVLSLCFLKIKNIYTVIGIFVAGFGIWLFVTQLWNNGVNPVNVLIFERLEYDDAKGIKGNNRTVKQTDFFFDRSVKDGSIWYGVRTQKSDKKNIVGAGYKIYFLRYGAVSAIFVAILYLMLISPNANKRYTISFFILMVLLFMQRAYPWGYSWLLPYVLGIGVTRASPSSKVDSDEPKELEEVYQRDI